MENIKQYLRNVQHSQGTATVEFLDWFSDTLIINFGNGQRGYSLSPHHVGDRLRVIDLSGRENPQVLTIEETLKFLGAMAHAFNWRNLPDKVFS